MAIRECDLETAIRWFCKGYAVPETTIGPGRPKGSKSPLQPHTRVGVSGSELEFLVRSGEWAKLTPTQQKIIPVLFMLRDPDTGLTTISYGGLMRYSGARSRKSLSRALYGLQRLHALQINRGMRVGLVRRCSSYRVTLEDPAFVEHCKETYRRLCLERDQECQTQLRNRIEREKIAAVRRFVRKQVVAASDDGGLRPPAPPVPLSTEELRSCKGLNLSSLSEPQANKTVQLLNREIRIPGFPSDAELTRRAQEQRARLDAWLEQNPEVSREDMARNEEG